MVNVNGGAFYGLCIHKDEANDLTMVMSFVIN